MPFTLTLTEGVLPQGTEKVAVARITDAMLKWHNLIGNEVMTPNVTALVHIIPRGRHLLRRQGLQRRLGRVEGAVVRVRRPQGQQGFFAETTEIIHELSGGKQPKDKIFINVVHAVDGAWNLDGRAMTNQELGEAIAKG